MAVYTVDEVQVSSLKAKLDALDAGGSTIVSITINDGRGVAVVVSKK